MEAAFAEGCAVAHRVAHRGPASTQVTDLLGATPELSSYRHRVHQSSRSLPTLRWQPPWRPFPPPSTGKIAVKVINDYGDEVVKVFQP
jgi:hypothetical protein